MAKFTEGINGPFKGKVGTVIGASWKGIPYMRSRPKKRTSEPSEREMANRKKWAMSQFWLQPVLDFVQLGFKGYSPKSEGFVAAKSYLMKNAFESEGPDIHINPALVKVSAGDLPLPATMQITQLEARLIQFTWDTAFPGEKAHEGDQVMLLAYNIDDGDADCNLIGQLRKNGSDVLKLSKNAAGTFHLYAAFNAYDRSRQSDSMYLGTVEV
ncbi:hypothetical protein FAM09_27110 [Niastella caeni]|uniref:Uncharacterized protein n=1 Tax=Niastella caeni TaxID=2569763 RepID=A0A4S8HCI2_9BACT|nr:DUF6266 family protein [Niastella caeni]THU32465.1 hypothetical protein FAM09_27110 [Niastella caeni]